MKLYPTCHVPRSMGGCDRSPEQGALLCETHREALCMRLMDATLAAARFCHPMSLFTTLYASALLIAGGFTFLPFRTLGRLTFGEVMPLINYGIVAVMVSLGVWLIWYSYRVARP